MKYQQTLLLGGLFVILAGCGIRPASNIPANEIPQVERQKVDSDLARIMGSEGQSEYLAINLDRKDPVDTLVMDRTLVDIGYAKKDRLGYVFTPLAWKNALDCSESRPLCRMFRIGYSTYDGLIGVHHGAQSRDAQVDIEKYYIYRTHLVPVGDLGVALGRSGAITCFFNEEPFRWRNNLSVIDGKAIYPNGNGYIGISTEIQCNGALKEGMRFPDEHVEAPGSN